MISNYWPFVTAAIGTIAVAIFLGVGLLMLVSRALRHQIMRMTALDRSFYSQLEQAALRMAVRREYFKVDGKFYAVTPTPPPAPKKS